MSVHVNVRWGRLDDMPKCQCGRIPGYCRECWESESECLAMLERCETMDEVRTLYFDRPTHDARAAALWHWSNATVSYELGSHVMRQLGYVPYQGFPLKRSS